MKSLKRTRTAGKKRGKPRGNGAPKAETPAPAAPPHPLAEAEALFDDGLIRSDTTLLQLVRGMFDASNASKSDNPIADFLSEVLLANNDELHLVQFVDGSLDHSDVIDRVLLRVQWRAEIAAEIARRVEKGEVLR